MTTLRVGDPLDKNTDVGAINSAAQLARIRELTDVGEAEGADRWSPPCELPDRGFWFAPTVFTGVSQAHRIAREEIFGPVLSVLTFRTPDEAVAQGEQHAVRAVGRRLDGEGLADPGDGRAAARRRGVGQHVQQVRPGRAVRRLQGVRASAARAAGTVWRRTSMSERHQGSDRRRRLRRAGAERVAVRKTYKLYIGGAFPRSESGRSYPVSSARGKLLAHAAQASRKDVRDAVVARRGRRSPAGRARPRTTAARCSTASPRCSRAAAPSSPTRSPPPRG